MNDTCFVMSFRKLTENKFFQEFNKKNLMKWKNLQTFISVMVKAEHHGDFEFAFQAVSKAHVEYIVYASSRRNWEEISIVDQLVYLPNVNVFFGKFNLLLIPSTVFIISGLSPKARLWDKLSGLCFISVLHFLHNL